MSYIGSHGGGAARQVSVTSSVQLLPGEEFDNSSNRPARKYALFVADSNNTETVYLLLRGTGPAVIGSGIPLPPGAGYEINFTNLYQGPVFAVSSSGAQIIHIQTGY